MEIFLSAALGLRFWKEACEWRRIGYQVRFTYAIKLTCAATTRQPSAVRTQVWLWRPVPIFARFWGFRTTRFIEIIRFGASIVDNSKFE
jgi:hypothetical protein